MNDIEINRLLADHATDRIIQLLTGDDALWDRRKFFAYLETVGIAAAARRVVIELVAVRDYRYLRGAILTSWVETMCALINWERVGDALLEIGP